MADVFAAVHGTLIIRSVCRQTVDKWNAMQLAAVLPTATKASLPRNQLQRSAAPRAVAFSCETIWQSTRKAFLSLQAGCSCTAHQLLPWHKMRERLLPLQRICTALRSLKCSFVLLWFLFVFVPKYALIILLEFGMRQAVMSCMKIKDWDWLTTL